jgi:hypothetical protein
MAHEETESESLMSLQYFEQKDNKVPMAAKSKLTQQSQPLASKLTLYQGSEQAQRLSLKTR